VNRPPEQRGACAPSPQHWQPSRIHPTPQTPTHQEGSSCAPSPGSGANLVVAAVDLALRVEDAAPVVGVEARLGIHVDQHLHLVAEHARLEGLQRARRLQLAGERANKRRRRAPRADQLARLQVERGAVQRADDGAILDGALVKRGANVRADVRGGEHRAALIGGDQNVQAGAEGSLERVGLELLLGAHGGPDVLDGEVSGLGATAHRDGRAAPLGQGRASLEGRNTDEEGQHFDIR